MARPFAPETEGKDDDLVPIQIKIPVWLRRRLVTQIANRSETMSGYVKRLLVEELGRRDDQRPQQVG